MVDFKSYLEEMLVRRSIRGQSDLYAKDGQLGLIKFDGYDASKMHHYFDELDPHKRFAIRNDSRVFNELKFRELFE